MLVTLQLTQPCHTSDADVEKVVEEYYWHLIDQRRKLNLLRHDHITDNNTSADDHYLRRIDDRLSAVALKVTWLELYGHDATKRREVYEKLLEDEPDLVRKLRDAANARHDDTENKDPHQHDQPAAGAAGAARPFDLVRSPGRRHLS
jgi:hypothetical protein